MIGKAETRQRILGAAHRVVQGQGVSGLTLEAVAREAAVSKGGLLYHFGTKEALIRGMLEDLLERFEAQIAVQLQGAGEQDGVGGASGEKEGEAGTAGRWLRAFVRATFATPLPDAALSSALLTAAATSPQLLDPVREAFGRWQARAEADGIDPELATVVRLAADGLWFADLFGAAPPLGPRRAAVEDVLVRLTLTPAPAGPPLSGGPAAAGAERS